MHKAHEICGHNAESFFGPEFPMPYCKCYLMMPLAAIMRRFPDEK
jgi:hypothetical protein